MVRSLGKKVAIKSSDPPELTDREWNVLGVLGLGFFLMAILQLSSFNDFKDWLEQIGLGQPTVWAVAIIIAEVWAAAGLFKLRLSPLFRTVSGLLALVVSGFWFVQSLRLVSDGASGVLQNSGFFGRFLAQSPSWWSVLEASLLLFGSIYAFSLFREYFNLHKT